MQASPSPSPSPRTGRVSTAYVANCTALCSPSLPRMLPRCLRTVNTAMPSRAAISRQRKPWPTSASTSLSRGVSDAVRACVPPPSLIEPAMKLCKARIARRNTYGGAQCVGAHPRFQGVRGTDLRGCDTAQGLRPPALGSAASRFAATTANDPQQRPVAPPPNKLRTTTGAIVRCLQPPMVGQAAEIPPQRRRSFVACEGWLHRRIPACFINTRKTTLDSLPPSSLAATLLRTPVSPARHILRCVCGTGPPLSLSPFPLDSRDRPPRPLRQRHGMRSISFPAKSTLIPIPHW